jgi:hypothetical protein
VLGSGAKLAIEPGGGEKSGGDVVGTGMSRALTFGVGLVVVVGGLAPVAASPIAPSDGTPQTWTQVRGEGRPRVVEAPYLVPVIGGSIEGENSAYYYDCELQIGCAIISLRRGDRFAKLRIKDTVGETVLGSIYTMPGGDHLSFFCGRTKYPLFVGHATELLVHVISGVCPGGESSVVTRGVVRATLYGRR